MLPSLLHNGRTRFCRKSKKARRKVFPNYMLINSAPGTLGIMQKQVDEN